jgi:hypothetical protein
LTLEETTSKFRERNQKREQRRETPKRMREGISLLNQQVSRSPFFSSEFLRKYDERKEWLTLGTKGDLEYLFHNHV